MRLIDADALIDDCKKYLNKLNPSRDGKECTRIHWLIGILSNAPTIEPEQQWIPCSERLPEEYGMYLVTKATRKTELEKGNRNHVSLCVEPYTKYSHWGKSTCGNVAWMPLPEPYREEGDTE